jgi:hypothetical protein
MHMTKIRAVAAMMAILLLAVSAGCTKSSTVERVYPRKKQSIESRVFVGQIKVSFATVKRNYNSKDTIPLCLQIKNTSDEVYTLNYASGQRYDFIIKNKAGDQLWQWQAGKNFALIATTTDLRPGQRQTFYQNIAPGLLKPGKYILEAQSIADELYSETLELNINVE